MWKRYRAGKLRHGPCFGCRYREITDGVYHCQRQPARQGGCLVDRKLPKFEFDGTVMEGLRDAG